MDLSSLGYNTLLYLGTDLLHGVIPAVCSADPRIRFLIGGDGPKRLMLEELREQHRLHERITLLGEVDQSKVRDVLVQVQPIRALYLGHVTGNQPIRARYLSHVTSN